MGKTPIDLDKLRSSLGGIEVDCMKGDNLAVTLCTYFENPSQERDGETGWTEDAIDGYEATLDAIHKHYEPLIAEAKQAREYKEDNLRLRGGLELLKENISRWHTGLQFMSDLRNAVIRLIDVALAGKGEGQ